ncbi:MAG: Fe(3+) ABC transporter substrate-binding protein [Arenicellales bacterium]
MILRIYLAAITLTSVILLGPGAQAEEVNVYSSRKPQLIQPMFDEFSSQTGIKVNAVFAEKGMLERLRSEGQNSPADIVFTVDIGRLTDFKNAGLTQATESDQIKDNIPPNLRDPENHWYGLTSRARIIVVAKDRVANGELASYEGLADPKWQGKICTRSGKHPYNIALISTMMAYHGTEKTERWLSAVKSNLARKPEGNDRGQVKAIREGLCDVAVINHYYMYKMVSDPEQKLWADAVNVIFPNQNDRGTHMNISGMAMTRFAPNADNALKLMEFLAGDQAQAMYAEVNGEYPVNQEIPLSEYLKSLGEFKRDEVELAKVADLRAEASKMVDRVAYNE